MNTVYYYVMITRASICAPRNRGMPPAGQFEPTPTPPPPTHPAPPYADLRTPRPNFASISRISNRVCKLLESPSSCSKQTVEAVSNRGVSGPQERHKSAAIFALPPHLRQLPLLIDNLYGVSKILLETAFTSALRLDLFPHFQYRMSGVFRPVACSLGSSTATFIDQARKPNHHNHPALRRLHARI